jgi:hypothetical protein
MAFSVKGLTGTLSLGRTCNNCHVVPLVASNCGGMENVSLVFSTSKYTIAGLSYATTAV